MHECYRDILIKRIESRLLMSDLYLAAVERDLDQFILSFETPMWVEDTSSPIAGILSDLLWDLVLVIDDNADLIRLDRIATEDPDQGIIALRELFNKYFGMCGWDFDKIISGEEIFDGV